MLGLVSIFTK